MENLLLPFQFEFMQNAFLVSFIIAIPTSLLSCFLVVRGWSLMGDAVSHAVLPGIVIAYIINIPLVIGAFCAGLFCALSTGYIKENCRVKHDTVMGVVFSGMFGFGIVLITKIETDVHLDHILFGNMLGVSINDLMMSSVISCLVTLFFILKWRDLLLCSFDETHAIVSGIRVKLLQLILLASMTLTIVATLKALGLILSISLIIAPGAIAFLINNRFRNMMIIAVFISSMAMFIGIYSSFWIDSAPAPTVILVLTIIFILAFILKTNKQKTDIVVPH